MPRIPIVTWSSARLSAERRGFFPTSYTPATFTIPVDDEKFANGVVKLAKNQFWCFSASYTQEKPGQYNVFILLKAEYNDQARAAIGKTVHTLCDMETSWRSPENVVTKIYAWIGSPEKHAPSDREKLCNSLASY